MIAAMLRRPCNAPAVSADMSLRSPLKQEQAGGMAIGGTPRNGYCPPRRSGSKCPRLAGMTLPPAMITS
jgi:hypothetical protein